MLETRSILHVLEKEISFVHLYYPKNPLPWNFKNRLKKGLSLKAHDTGLHKPIYPKP
ncbi:hypothetical protein Hdeb2414_s0190g00828221 [Helianthus debilis subsp. tardiflorus]